MPPTPQLLISAADARRFLVRRHLLAPPRGLPAEPESVLAVVDRLGSLQFDPLEVPGARSHDLVLHARIRGYRRAWCDQWLYGPERRLIELYNKSLNILPLSELPYHRISWERNRRHYDLTILRDQAKTVSAILERIRAEGPLSTSAFGDHAHAVDWWWAPTRAARAVMEALFVTGGLGIERREGNRRYYDLIERLVPGDLLARSEGEEDAMRHRMLSRYRAVGLLAGSGQAEIVHGTGTTPERLRRVAELVDAGLLTAADVEGMPTTRYLLTEELTILSDARPVPAAVTFLAPLDPLVWDRRQLRGLFGFDYLWEVYVPAAKRRWGYYVLPILFGDRFVGRIEPRYERSRRGLRILGIWFEAGFEAKEEPGFVPALADAVEAYRMFVGADRVSWPRTRSGREIAAALRSLG